MNVVVGPSVRPSFCLSVTLVRAHSKSSTESHIIFIVMYILQANEQNIKISIKQTQTQPQYSMSHGRRRVVTPLIHVTKSKNTNTHMHNNTRITED